MAGEIDGNDVTGVPPAAAESFMSDPEQEPRTLAVRQAHVVQLRRLSARVTTVEVAYTNKGANDGTVVDSMTFTVRRGKEPAIGSYVSITIEEMT